MKGKHECPKPCLLKHVIAHFELCVCVGRCVNPNDPNVFVLHMSDSTNRYQRRFMIKAFVFMEQKTNKYLDEDVSIQEAIMDLNDKFCYIKRVHTKMNLS